MLWDVQVNASVDNGVLSKDGNGLSWATSKNILYGNRKAPSKLTDGSFKFVFSEDNGPKAIGFTVVSDEKQRYSDMKYAFILKRNKNVVVKHEGANVAQTSINIGDELTISRVHDTIKYLVNDNVVYFSLIDTYEDLLVGAILHHPLATFSNVEASFATFPLEVVFDVDNENNSISYVISGGIPPYKAVWGDSRSREQNYTPDRKGTFELSVTDDAKNRIFRKVSIGYNVDWQNFNKTTQTDNNLVRLNGGGNSWGTAESQASIDENSDWWVEYSAEIEDDPKIFGVHQEGLNNPKVKDIIAGFYVSDNDDYTIKIIENGQVISKNPYHSNDILKIEKTKGVLLWSFNGAVIHKSKYINQGSLLKIGGAVKPNSTISNLRYLSNYPELIQTTYNDSTLNGSITINLPVEMKEGPYHYYISEAPLPDLDEFYNIAKDSFGLVLDSSFFAGNHTSKSYTFEGLKFGEYFVSVYNSEGKILLGEEVRLTPNIKFISNTGIEQAGNLLVSNSDDALSELLLFANEEVNNSRYGYIVPDERGAFMFGFQNDSVEIVDQSSLKYGFIVNNGSVRIINDGVISPPKYFARRNSSIYLEIKDGLLNFVIDEKIILSEELPTEFSYKSILGVKKGGFTLIPILINLRPYRYRVNSNITYVDCNQANGQLEVEFLVNSNWFWSFNSISYSLYDENFNVVGSSNSLQALFTNLSAGTYYIIGGITYNNIFGGTISTIIFRQYTVGYKMEWINFMDASYSSLDESLYRSNNSGNFLGYASSNNKVELPGENWIDFNLKYDSEFINLSALEWSSTNTNGIVNNEFVFFFKWGNTVFLYYVFNGSVVSQNSINVSDRLRVSYDGSSAKIYKNGNQIISAPASSGKSLINAFVGALNSGFSDVYTNMNCAVPILYAKLERKMRGVKYEPIDNELYFFNTEEYFDDDETLNYKVYNTNRSVVLSPLNQSLINFYGDNRLSLDVTSLTSGAYVLEVENDKNELFYLRFVKP
ncbi:MAG: hypothetical protein COA32_10765 [Fluviicola sp.]|nr:MAG: hypothetical protein COA32_10765 [Fluviicola sp.]